MKSNTQNQAAERNFLLYRLDVAQRRPPGDYKTAVIAGIEHSLRFLEGGQRSALHPAPSNYLRNATLPTMPSESAAPVLRHGRSRMSTVEDRSEVLAPILETLYEDSPRKLA